MSNFTTELYAAIITLLTAGYDTKDITLVNIMLMRLIETINKVLGTHFALTDDQYEQRNRNQINALQQEITQRTADNRTLSDHINKLEYSVIPGLQAGIKRYQITIDQLKADLCNRDQRNKHVCDDLAHLQLTYTNLLKSKERIAYSYYVLTPEEQGYLADRYSGVSTASNGGLIKAIKSYQNRTGLSLGNCKAVMIDWATKLGLSPPPFDMKYRIAGLCSGFVTHMKEQTDSNRGYE